MVLVSLQTELGNREMDIPVRIDGKPVPLHQNLEAGHREGPPRPPLGPGPLADLPEPAAGGAQRQHRFHQHPPVPRPRWHACWFGGSPAFL
jgi:hypothetical protein